ncbi:16S rRNA (guanine(527)-N(7))-methyltransferase RsmG [Vagococcus elongatus]|uniref:Ribosomal RNA small subunit methyltransferase G n=1 Tax=Vagococcus elongatus TaxID=180344 RepID=A0A430AUX9_9ENTE|nr:16S rRNA (guanine(527)-N(7))-methyltransferase RsmG [Vagococcus elongatus]RSU11856.1 16S rRNA (guanine(527)-N(7))-methyltransferase RsmG [Vagococcus elongatus]
MTPEEFKERLENYGIHLTDEQMQQYELYFDLLVDWNKKINLTAITEKQEVYLKHFFDSLMLVSAEETFRKNLSLCDVGAGAGFPSIPLKIAFPELKVTIVDSLNKRIKFLTELVEKLNLSDVFLYHDRAETFGKNKDFRESFDLVTARAVARLNVLAELCLPLVKQEGYFVALKAMKSEEEVAEARKAINLLGGKFIEEIEIALPGVDDTRNLVVVQKKKATPRKYPRKPGIPNKQPLT